MHDIAGLVALAIVGLWIAYLVPHRLRYRQQLLESRTEDRFSVALRVLAVTDPRGPRRRVVETRAECGPDSPKRSGLLSPARGVPTAGRQAVTERKGGVVERPYGTQDKISADAARRQAQLRAQRAAAVSRRAAAAKRRAVLTVALLAVAAGAWVVVGLTSVAVMAAVVPTVLLAGVLGLGRRAVVQGQAADAAWEQQQRRPLSEADRPAARGTRITGRALHPSDRHTEAVPHVTAQRRSESATATAAPPQATSAGSAGDEVRASGDADYAPTSSSDRSDASDRRRDGESSSVADSGERTSAADDEHSPSADDREATAPRDDESWSPVPVPRPTYTTKATAPRREPLPLVVDDPVVTPPGVVAATSDADADGAVSTPPAIDLDAVLARRRAAGE